MQRVFRDLPSLCPHTLQRAGVATGPESRRAGGVHLWGHLSAASILDPVQRTTTRIDSKSLMNHLEAGALGNLTLAGNSSPARWFSSAR